MAVTGQGCEIITEHEHVADMLQTSRAPGPWVYTCYSPFLIFVHAYIYETCIAYIVASLA